MWRPTVVRARSGPWHAVQLLGLRKWTRQIHQLLRLSEREELHPYAIAPRDPGVETESPNRELLQLWRVHRPASQFSLSLLPFRHFHAGHEAAATDASAAEGSCRAYPSGSDTSLETRHGEGANIVRLSGSRRRVVGGRSLRRLGPGWPEGGHPADCHHPLNELPAKNLPNTDCCALRFSA